MAIDPFPKDRASELMRRVPAYLRLALGLAKDPALSKARRAAIIGAAGYLVSPVDLVPGIIPVLGQLDDIAIAIAAVKFALAGLSPERRRAHLEAVGLGDDLIVEDLKTLGVLSAWVVRAGGRTTAKVARAGGRAAVKGSNAAVAGSKAALRTGKAAGGAAGTRLPGAASAASTATAAAGSAALAAASAAARASAAGASVKVRIIPAAKGAADRLPKPSRPSMPGRPSLPRPKLPKRLSSGRAADQTGPEETLPIEADPGPASAPHDLPEPAPHDLPDDAGAGI